MKDLKMSDSNSLSPSIQNEGKQNLLALKEKAGALNIDSFYGVATEAFRKADNGQDYIDMLQ